MKLVSRGNFGKHIVRNADEMMQLPMGILQRYIGKERRLSVDAGDTILKGWIYGGMILGTRVGDYVLDVKR
jgi:hypothetical protein